MAWDETMGSRLHQGMLHLSAEQNRDTLGKPHFTTSPLNPKRFPSNKSAWTLSRVYPPFEATMPSLPLSTMGAPKVPYSCHVPLRSLEWELPNCISTTSIDGLGSP